jgi:hypothetical protein
MFAELTKAQRDEGDQTRRLDLMHVISFLERAILHLDHTKIGTDIMELLAVLFQGWIFSGGLCRHGESEETTPKVLAIGALLSTVLVLLEDSSAERRLWMLFNTCIGKLLQAKTSLVFRNGSSGWRFCSGPHDVRANDLTACQRVSDSNAGWRAS